jgi:hypothetical protein
MFTSKQAIMKSISLLRSKDDLREKSGRPAMPPLIHVVSRPIPNPLVLILAIIALLYCFGGISVLPAAPTVAPIQHESSNTKADSSALLHLTGSTEKALVPLEAHIMSKCPVSLSLSSWLSHAD